PRRRVIEGHHTVTHLLHWALHEVVSRDATQKGSYVGPDKLTFDFSSAALTPEQKRDVEKLVNEKISENAPVSWTEVPYVEAKKRKDIQQFFGEKYGDLVRVVQVGGEPKKLNGYSMELCGGTHVKSTSEIGALRRVREEASAAGTGRIEAVADAMKQKFDGPIVLAATKDGNVALVAVVPKQLTSKFQANKIIQQIAPIVGGKGGGRPESAQGGGADADKIDIALTEAKRLL